MRMCVRLQAWLQVDPPTVPVIETPDNRTFTQCGECLVTPKATYRHMEEQAMTHDYSCTDYSCLLSVTQL